MTSRASSAASTDRARPPRCTTTSGPRWRRCGSRTRPSRRLYPGRGRMIIRKTPEAKRLLASTKAALFDAVEQCRPGNRLGDVSHAVQKRIEGDGFAVVRSLVGHGIGRDMHEDPQIPNFGEPGTGPLLAEGMVLAVEPMVNIGTYRIRIADDQWSVYSEDGSLAAHFEHTVAITSDGPRILTPWHLAEERRAA